MADNLGYADAELIRRSLGQLLRPRQRVSVSEVVANTLRINTPGGYSGPIDFELAPYIAEPLDVTGSRNVESMIFVGPAQSIKTFGLIGGRIAYAVEHDPADQLVIQMSQDTARDWSRKELARWIRASPKMSAQISPRPRDNNTFDVFWANGSILKIGWPSVTQLSSKSVRDVMLTDYDRMPDDISGEGSAFGLGLKRTTVWMSRGITMAESSPGRDIPPEHMGWKRPDGSNLGPPVSGILGLYNQGDRRRWWWPCPHCGEFFEAEPGIGLFRLPSLDELKREFRSYSVSQLVARFELMGCAANGCTIDQSKKRAMNIAGRWLNEGERIDPRGDISGSPVRSSIASFWLGGVAAAFQSWHGLVEKHLRGVNQWAQSGDTTLLKQTINTDQAMPFLPPGIERQQSDSLLQASAETWPRGSVPPGVRFLLMTADVQSGRFVCQVTGFGWIGGRLEWWMIDRFEISESKRGGPVKPHVYAEDWDLVTERAESLRYALPDGRMMAVLHTSVDSGGMSDDGSDSSVTVQAYAWFRRMQAAQKSNRFGLVKGASGNEKNPPPRFELRYPDTRNKGGASSGDVPVLFVGTRELKDAVSGDLTRSIDGNGAAHLPDWLDPEIFAELTAEVRGPKGWIRHGKVAQEAFDLTVYARAKCAHLKADTPQFWAQPPAWAADWERNVLVSREGGAPQKTAPRPLRRATSNYMGS